MNAVSSRPAVAAVAGDTFRQIMSALPAGVSLVTTVDTDGRPRGMTATAVCSVSLDPPILLVCIDRRSRTLAAIRHRGAFAVNILGAESEAIARLFASSAAADFGVLPWRASDTAHGVPVLTSGVVGSAECRVSQIMPMGDHDIVFALVVGGGADDAAALSYARRTYHPVRVSPDDEKERA